MADTDEVLDQSPRAIGVIANDQIAIGVGQRPIDQDEGKTASQQGEYVRPRPIAGGRQHKAFYAMSDEVFDVFALQAEITLAVAEENPVARLARRALRPPDDRSEKRVHYIGNDEADRLRLLRKKTAGDPIRHIVERLDRLLDPPPGFRVHPTPSINDS